MERLFSKVGVAFTAKRKRAEAETLENIMFARHRPTCLRHYLNVKTVSVGENSVVTLTTIRVHNT